MGKDVCFATYIMYGSAPLTMTRVERRAQLTGFASRIKYHFLDDKTTNLPIL
jgi:hypothetical protein